MLFCKSSTVKVGTIALICTASCVVATIASFCFVVFAHPQASGPRPDLQARPCNRAEVLPFGFGGMFRDRRAIEWRCRCCTAHGPGLMWHVKAQTCRRS